MCDSTAIIGGLINGKDKSIMPNIDDRIRNIDNDAIYRDIASADFSPRGAVAQDVLA